MIDEMGYEEQLRRKTSALTGALEGVVLDGLMDDSVTEVMIDPSGRVSYDRLYGTLEPQVGKQLESRAVVNLISKLAQGRSVVGEAMLETELQIHDVRIRVQAWLPEVSPLGAAANLRKHRRQGKGKNDFPALKLPDYGLPSSYNEAFHECAETGGTILFVGPTGSGKTTGAGAYLGLLTEKFPTDHVVTIEDVREIYCESESWLALCANDKVSQARLLRSAMRARPDVLALSEARDKAAKDMIMSFGTGHGGFSTVHGGSIVRGIVRVHDLADGELSESTVCEAITYGVLMRRDRKTGKREFADMAKINDWRDDRVNLTQLPR
jgi:Flp pilus assembly CpaF family ATPase